MTTPRLFDEHDDLPLFTVPSTPAPQPGFRINPVMHQVLTASSGTIASLTGYNTYTQLDNFLNWAAVEYVEKNRTLSANNVFDAVREAHAAYKQEIQQ